MDMLKQEKNRGYVIAGIGGTIGFIAFLLPYVSVSVLGYGASISGASAAGWLWFEAIAAIVAIAVPALLIYRSNPFGMATTPIEKQIRWGIYTIIGAGVFGLLIHILFAVDVNNISYNGVSLGSLVSVGLSFGYWLYLLCALAIIVGGVFAMRAAKPAAATVPPQVQTWQYPPPSTQYPPQAQQYPPYQEAQQQQYPPQAQQYPTYPQQQWGQQPPQQYPQQYPPAQQPPQQYPPVQQPPQYPPS